MNQCEGCDLSNLGNKYRICIPPPSDKIRGCLISRDPTSEFLSKLQDYKQLSPGQKEKENLWFDAPPLWLCNKIGDFMNFSENTQGMCNLRQFLDHQCYWTHLHKCPTCKLGKKQDQNQNDIREINEYFPPFRYRTAKACANRWLKFEFDKYELKDKIIITCGRHVEKFLRQWSKQHLIENDINVINLPHPSDANCGNGWSWNKNTTQKERITEEITRLLNLLDAEVEKG
jgi:hypothetical protein